MSYIESSRTIEIAESEIPAFGLSHFLQDDMNYGFLSSSSERKSKMGPSRSLSIRIPETLRLLRHMRTMQPIGQSFTMKKKIVQ
jgi:hypothetical protein